MPEHRPGLRPGIPTREEREQELSAALDRMLPKLIEMGALKVILFGSVARGDVGWSSDLDLIVVMDTQERFLDRLKSVYKAVSPGTACDILVYTPEEFEQMPAQSSMIRTALREGKVLYEAESEG